jgi:hypothetical protein
MTTARPPGSGADLPEPVVLRGPHVLPQSAEPGSMTSIVGRLWGWGAIVVALAVPRPVHADIALNLYGDLDGVVKTTGTRSGTQDWFSAAKLDLFATTTAGRWLFLAETMFEAEAEGGNSFGLDVERIEVGYLHRDWLRVLVGRFHSAIGYYNDAFHHGTYFMLPADRPEMVEFEDEGGLIPAHNVGVHADGRVVIGDDHLRYDLELANGRTADRHQVQNSHDTNLSKSVNLRLRYEPVGSLDGLVVGGNVYVDSIPAGAGAGGVAAGAPAPLGAIHEWIVGAHAAYFEHDLHVVTEAILVQHTELATGARHRTYAAFAEVGRSFDRFTPYARYEWTRFPREGDPYYRKAASDGYQTGSLGVNHATSDHIALKAEAAVTFSRAPSADALLALTCQVAFAF